MSRQIVLVLEWLYVLSCDFDQFHDVVFVLLKLRLVCATALTS